MEGINGKKVVVVGGAGLIGTTIVTRFKKLGATVMSMDINKKCEVTVDVLSQDWMKWHEHNDSVDVWVNTPYPSNHDMHVFAFNSSSLAAAERFKKKGGGAIINIASIYGVVGSKPSLYDGLQMEMPMAYAMAKGGVIALTRWIATNYGRYGVRANCVSPGGVYSGQPVEFVERYCERVPLGRMAVPEDVASAVVFLASDEASYITGQNLMVDGGLTSW